MAPLPLNTDDTGTQGKGGWQLELNGERNQDRVDGETVKGAQAAAVLSHGVDEAVDLQFWEQGPLSAGLRAGVTSPTGDEDRGLGNGKPTWAVLLIGQYEGERWIFLAHAGYRRNSNVFGDRESIGELSGAVLYKATGQLKLLVDANRTTNARIRNRTRRSARWSSARSIPRARTSTWTSAFAAGTTRRSSAR